MSELKNGFLTAEEVMDILQIKQSKASIRHIRSVAGTTSSISPVLIL